MNHNYTLRKHTRLLTAKLLALVCCIAIPLYLIQCTSNAHITGTGSQSGNGRVSCAIYNNDSSPASGARVYLRLHDYTASSELKKSTESRYDAVTDINGMFSIDSVDTGNYNIEVNDGKSHAVLLNCTITEKDTLVNIPSDTLQPTGTIKGVLTSAPDDSASLYIQVYGLERVGIYDRTTGIFTINDIPRGSYTLRVQESSKNYQQMEIKDVKIASNETTDIGKIDIVNQNHWQYSKELYLNTSPTGANVAGTVTNFPILVRLQSSNFDFNLAKTDGSDLRFSKTNGVSLPFEIEQWDAVNREAEIWVKVDTIYGNDSTHSIAMYWGNSNATDNSNSSNVFDTADNVTAVWHLNKNCNDATIDKHDGLENSARDTSGLIGHCKKFNGSDSIKVAGLLGSPTSITLSAWAQLDSTPASGNEIISIGDVALIREDYTLDSLGTDAIIHLSDNTVFYNVPSGKFLKKTGWHFIAFTLDQNTFTPTLYIDGEKAGTRTDLNTPLNYNGMGQNTYIGKHGNGKNDFGFIGRIDEVRVYRAAMSSDYIKLSFMNQKANEALVVFK